MTTENKAQFQETRIFKNADVVTMGPEQPNAQTPSWSAVTVSPP